MGFELTQVESLAPDQASLKAASGLAKQSKWLTLNHEADLWWGECQGSGANPYRTVVDSGQVGYKCTCPSRKFPCKHSLALMWLVAQSPQLFTPGTTPEWVSDWLGRRRTTATPDASDDKPKPSKSITQAVTDSEMDDTAADDPAAAAKKEAASRKRQETTRAMIADGIDDLDGWISDQLQTGLMTFTSVAADRCRRIAARLVDNKAAGLASRLDEMPSRLLAVPSEERPDAAIREFGKLVLLTKAWLANPDDPQASRDVATAPRRDDILADLAAPRVPGRWEVVGEQIRNRRDGLVSHSTWFLQVGADDTRFALLLDFYPASSGRPETSFVVGTQYDGAMVFYPGTAPLRAIATDLTPVSAAEQMLWPSYTGTDPLSQLQPFADAVPWQLEYPVLLPAGRVVIDDRQHLWWRCDSGAALPLADGACKAVTPQILGIPLYQGVGVWDGLRLAPLSGVTPLGKAQLT
ncbi:MAG: SWIM zinc finger family protein [Propionibacteriaceae bacterium]|nr:SWIM zinc finger family protein [Propionibacteriaceae bacterium]